MIGRRIAVLFLCVWGLAACGGSDSGGGGAAGAGGGGGLALGDGSAGGAGGAAGSGGGATGDAGLCKATTNPFPTVDCDAACALFADPSCPSPYGAQCKLACTTTEGSIPYSNALWGCAATSTSCAAWQSCISGICD